MANETKPADKASQDAAAQVVAGAAAPTPTPIFEGTKPGIQVPAKGDGVSKDPGPEAHQPQEPFTPVSKDDEPQAETETEAASPVPAKKLVKMTRDGDGPNEADVHPAEVENYERNGWAKK